MGRPRRNKPLPETNSSVCARMEWFLKHVWQNNIAAMAREAGVSHPAMSRVLAGQMPSGKILEAMAKRSEINLRWLLAGDGKPTDGGSQAGGVLLPLANKLLLGDPIAFPELLSPLTMPAAMPFHLEAAYWFRATTNLHVVMDQSSRISAGDYLLIETGPRWTRRSKAYLRRLLILRDGKEAIFAKHESDVADEMEDTPQHNLATFGRHQESRLFPTISREEARTKMPISDTAGSDMVRFYADDVVGVVLQTVNYLD